MQHITRKTPSQHHDVGGCVTAMDHGGVINAAQTISLLYSQSSSNAYFLELLPEK